MSDEELTAEDALGGSYEVIRNRLTEQGRNLGKAALELNDARREQFGASGFDQQESILLRTENNCIPIDIINLNGDLLFGYNVFVGLRQNQHVDETFALHEVEFSETGIVVEHATDDEKLQFLHGSVFAQDYSNLLNYNKDAELIRLQSSGGKFLSIFQMSKDRASLKAFRWYYDSGKPLRYIDDFGLEDHKYPDPHDFEWIQTNAQDFIRGEHPHVNILDAIFVEMVGGDLTIKIEDNTADGSGIYAEPVLDLNQSLDDGRIFYAKVGKLIILKMVPYREEARYLVYNTITQEVARVDAIGLSCLSLPEDQGVIFPGGYVLAEGGWKVFDNDIEDLEYQGFRKAPNGEEILYVYWRRRDGHYLLISYNLVNKEVSKRIECHGYCFFDDGHLVYFRAKSNEPTRVHKMDVWKTPFMSEEQAAEEALEVTGFLGKLGNPELVRAISDALGVQRMVNNDQPTSQLFNDISKSCTRMIDSYGWLAREEAFSIKSILQEIRRSSDSIVDEFLKVQAQQKVAVEQLNEAKETNKTILREVRPERYRTIEEFTSAMFQLDKHRAYLRSKEEVKFISKSGLGEIISEADNHLDLVCKRCADFLLKDDSLLPISRKLEDIQKEIPNIDSSKKANPIAEKLDSLLDGVMVLVNTLDRLEIDDHEAQLKIGQSITTVQSLATKVKQALQRKQDAIRLREAEAQFASKLQLFELSLETASSRATTPEEADQELTRLSSMLDDLESRFGDIDEFADQIDEKREIAQSALFAIKQALLEKRQQRVSRLFRNGEKILEGLRAKTFKELGNLRNFFATDRRVERLRKLAVQIEELNDSVKSEELRSNLKACEQDALRKFRDASELFVGGNLIQFGKHRFSVNQTSFELTLAPYEDTIGFHITGTDFHEAIEEQNFMETKRFWNQLLPSENEDVYRAEYLAASLLLGAEDPKTDYSFADLEFKKEDQTLLPWIQEQIGHRPDEGYSRGIHDEDALKILEQALFLKKEAGVLEYPSNLRAFAVLWWENFADRDRQKQWKIAAASYQKIAQLFLRTQESQLSGILAQEVDLFAQDLGYSLSDDEKRLIGEFLVLVIANEPVQFVLHSAASDLAKEFKTALSQKALWYEFEQALRGLQGDIPAQFHLVMDWLRAFVKVSANTLDFSHFLVEAAVFLLTKPSIWQVHTVDASVSIEGLQGTHKRITDGKYQLFLDTFLLQMRSFVGNEVPAYREYRRKRVELLEQANKRLRLSELRPRVLTSFVRNRLINDVYLHLIGDNLAKQMGASGDKKRTDLMGMLLLISPPGYGKTTLMEYVASRLGLAFVKVNGPSLGHDVVSLDPEEAPNATAKQEVEKINLAFEMANNVMLYLDDIQHTNPEFLQKFISLCDGQRRVEGVWKGRTRTYDLRGKKFSVVMAGNPYTETGEKFRIPDMLANRADIYNLGDVLSGRGYVFGLSYIENSLTSNPILAPLATRTQKDIYKLVQMAEGEEIPMAELEHQYSKSEVDEIVRTLQHLMRCRDVLLKVNAQYIFSAAQDEQLRTEPAFKLQGSYRNMNKLAEKIVSAMNDDEVEALITDHYRGESQTLTTGARANLLKLEELRGRLSKEEATEWERIKDEFVTIRRIGGSDDPVSRVVGSLTGLQDQLKRLGDQSAIEVLGQKVDAIPQSLRALEAILPRILQETQKEHNELDVSGLVTNLSQSFQNTSNQSLKELAKLWKQDEEQGQMNRLISELMELRNSLKQQPLLLSSQGQELIQAPITQTVELESSPMEATEIIPRSQAQPQMQPQVQPQMAKIEKIEMVGKIESVGEIGNAPAGGSTPVDFSPVFNQLRQLTNSIRNTIENTETRVSRSELMAEIERDISKTIEIIKNR